MKKRELTIEDILEVDDLVLDIKQNSNTEFLTFFSNEIIKKLIDYCTKMPTTDTKLIGYKYPFNACQLLSSDNTAIMRYFMNASSKSINQITESEEEHGLIIGTYEQYKYSETPETKNNEDVPMINRTGSKEFGMVTYHNLDYFLSFLNASLVENEVNLVLSGYFSEIFVHLIEVKGDEIIKYIFNCRPNVLDDLLKHVQFKSINECISHILLFTSDYYDDFQLMKYKQVFLEKILLRLSDTSIVKNNYECLCEMLMLTLSSKKVSQVLLSYGPCINLIFQILFKAKGTKIHLQSIIQLITTLNDLILSLFKNKVTDNYQVENLVNIQEIYGLNLCLNITKFLQKEDKSQPYNILTESNLGLIIKTIYDKGLGFLKDIINIGDSSGTFSINANTTHNIKQEVLGMNRLIQLRYLRSLIDIIINSYANDFFIFELNGIILYICNKGILINSIDYFFRFQLNTLYQNLFIQIVSIICNRHSPQMLIDHFFTQGDFFTKILSFILNKAHFTFKYILNGCFAPLIQICNILVQSSNQYVKQLIGSNKDFRALYEILIKDVSRKYNSKLVYLDPPDMKNKDSIINNINKEVKHSSFSNYTIYELINEEIELFRLYMEGDSVKIKLNSLRTRLLSAWEDGDSGDCKDTNEQSSNSSGNNTIKGDNNDNILNGESYINTNIDSRNDFDGESRNMYSPFNSSNEGSAIKSDNYYYDNSYWSCHHLNASLSFSIDNLFTSVIAYKDNG